MSVKIKEKTINEIIKIIENDYGVLLTADQANNLSISLLRLTKLAMVVLARVPPNTTLRC